MTFRSRKAAVVFASMLGAAVALPLAARADTMPLPGQPGANTAESAVAARGGPYMVMVLASSGMMTERQITPGVASELMKHAKPLHDTMVLVHGGKAYLVEDMKTKSGRMLTQELEAPQNMEGWF